MPMWRMPSGIGSTPGTTAGTAHIIQNPTKSSISLSSGSVAWILCLSKPSRNTIGWRDSSMVSFRSPNIFNNKIKLTNDDPSQAMFLTSGPPVVSVTLMVATAPTSSQRTSTGGSGRRTRLVSVQPMVPPSMTGPALEVSAPRDLSRTTENKFSR